MLPLLDEPPTHRGSKPSKHALLVYQPTLSGAGTMTSVVVSRMHSGCTVVRTDVYETIWLSGTESDVVILDGKYHLQPDHNLHRLVSVLQARFDKPSKQAAFRNIVSLMTLEWDQKRMSGAQYLHRFHQYINDYARVQSDDQPVGNQPFGPAFIRYLLLKSLPDTMKTEVTVLLSKPDLTLEDIEEVIRRQDELNPKPKGGNNNDQQQPEKANTSYSKNRAKGRVRTRSRGTGTERRREEEQKQSADCIQFVPDQAEA